MLKPAVPVWLAFFMYVVAAAAQPPAGAGTAVDRLAFLLGEWVTHEDTELGHADALSTFSADLDRHIVTRRSTTRYSTGRNAGTGHSDLLIVYAEGPDSGLRAIYFDGEGHVIHYQVTIPAANTVVFESAAEGSGPRYRLTHTVSGDRLETRFAIAPPGQGEFRTYVSGVSVRKPHP